VERGFEEYGEARIGQPERRHLAVVQPSQGVVFGRIQVGRLPIPLVDDPDVHAEVLAADLGEAIPGNDGGDTELLQELAMQGLVGRLTALDVAAREIPAVGVPTSSRHTVEQQAAAAASQQPGSNQVEIFADRHRFTFAGARRLLSKHIAHLVSGRATGTVWGGVSSRQRSASGDDRMMSRTGDLPPDVRAWPGVEITGPLTGGARSGAWAARRGTNRLVVKVSTRSAQSLDWELDLLRALHQNGLSVPTAVPTADGSNHQRGVWVAPFLPGGSPRSSRNWQEVAETVAALHSLTASWPQRPGAASARDLLLVTAGADVNLLAMSAETMALVRASWRALLEQVTPDAHGFGESVVHGDLGPGAVLVDDSGGGGVSLIDFDEARVDVAAFDLAGLPRPVRKQSGATAKLNDGVLELAGLAWETATCWVIEPDYARRCLQQLRQHPSASYLL